MIISDQGANFTSQLFLSICQLFQVTKKRTGPYRPSANGQVVRSNRTILQLLRCYAKEQNQWDKCLPQIGAAIRATVHRQTGFTPNRMMLGREVNGPLELMLGSGNSKIENEEEYVATLSRKIENAHELVRKHLKSSQKRQKQDYDVNLKQYRYEPGDLVYEINSSLKVGVCQKLEKIWKGPLLVVKVLSPLLYVVRDRKRERVVHHDRLQGCKDRTIPVCMLKLRNKCF